MSGDALHIPHLLGDAPPPNLAWQTLVERELANLRREAQALEDRAMALRIAADRLAAALKPKT